MAKVVLCWQHFGNVYLALLIHNWDKSKVLMIFRYFRVSLLHTELSLQQIKQHFNQLMLIMSFPYGFQTYILNMQDISRFFHTSLPKEQNKWAILLLKLATFLQLAVSLTQRVVLKYQLSSKVLGLTRKVNAHTWLWLVLIIVKDLTHMQQYEVLC